jgi:hypothetical protein
MLSHYFLITLGWAVNFKFGVEVWLPSYILLSFQRIKRLVLLLNLCELIVVLFEKLVFWLASAGFRLIALLSHRKSLLFGVEFGHAF